MLVELLPEFEQAIGFEQESRYHDLTVDEHTFAVVQAAADAGTSLAVRLAALFHDLGKPHVAWRGADGRLHYYAKPGHSQRSHEQVGAELATQRAATVFAIRMRCARACAASCGITCSASATATRGVRGVSSRSTATRSPSS